MAHLCVNENLRVHTSCTPCGVIVIKNRGFLKKTMKQLKFQSLSEALEAIANAQQCFENYERELVEKLLKMNLEIADIGEHCEEVVEKISATGLSRKATKRALNLAGFSEVIINDVQFYSGSLNGKAGYLQVL